MACIGTMAKRKVSCICETMRGRMLRLKEKELYGIQIGFCVVCTVDIGKLGDGSARLFPVVIELVLRKLPGE